jgi:hypothetical protein
MHRTSWFANAFRSQAATTRGSCRRARNLQPACDHLDSRQLLSGASMAMVSLPAPSPQAAANAAAILDALDPTTFTQFQSDLARAEAHSRVTRSQVNRLALDEAAIDQAIELRGLDSSTTAKDLNQAQVALDAAFHPYLARGLVQKKQVIAQLIAGVSGSRHLAAWTDAQILAVARSAGITGRYHETLSRDEQILTADLGPNPDADLGPGAENRDPLVVYYDSQLEDFVK